MDYGVVKLLSQDIRDSLLKQELGEDKTKILDKYGLVCNENLYWEKIQDKYPTQEYFSHKFLKKASPIGIVFHFYRLCYAKVKYFEANWNDYIPCKYDLKKGYIETEIYDMEFIQQKASGTIIDIRELCRIKRIEDFRDLCAYLENLRDHA